MSYCVYCKSEKAKQIHVDYHDKVYGYPVESDHELFERLILEINQAGLSWELILNKQKYFQLAFDGFNIEKVANYCEKERQRLLNDKRIVRNKLKIDAAIHNARQILEIQVEFGSFKEWLDLNHPLTKNEWVKLFKKRFKFVGGEILNEFLMGVGYLPGAHDKNCPIFDEILTTNPKWNQV
ncbi:MAG: DNA-3-methyladenine glycosylase I [Crocinitomicaceae bacterium]|nr:DNA-3-methyladenine glycosylase I [Crocinitomicaceae bacterium]